MCVCLFLCLLVCVITCLLIYVFLYFCRSVFLCLVTYSCLSLVLFYFTLLFACLLVCVCLYGCTYVPEPSILSFENGGTPKHAFLNRTLICSYLAKLPAHGNRAGDGQVSKIPNCLRVWLPRDLRGYWLSAWGPEGLAGHAGSESLVLWLPSSCHVVQTADPTQSYSSPVI